MNNKVNVMVASKVPEINPKINTSSSNIFLVQELLGYSSGFLFIVNMIILVVSLINKTTTKNNKNMCVISILGFVLLNFANAMKRQTSVTLEYEASKSIGFDIFICALLVLSFIIQIIVFVKLITNIKKEKKEENLNVKNRK